MPISQLTAIALYGHAAGMQRSVERFAILIAAEPIANQVATPLHTLRELVDELYQDVTAAKRQALLTLTGDPEYNQVAGAPLFEEPASE